MNGRSAPPRTQIAALNRLQSGLTTVLVLVALVALAFTATNVTMFAIQHEVSPWIAWLLDPMVAVALGAVLIVDGRLSEYGVNPSGWASGLRWFAGLGTWVMNCWGSLWPEESAFGVPRQVDPAGLVLHSIPPVLLIVLAEAITHYRRAILGKIAELRAEVEAASTQVETGSVHPPSTPVTTPLAPAPTPEPAAVAVESSPLVICGDRKVFPLTVPPVSTRDEGDHGEAEKLTAQEALRVIRTCWMLGDSIPEAARKSTRSTSYVHKVYSRLRDQSSDPETAGHDRVAEAAVA
ncbi:MULTISPECIES: hypothetical protein [Streptomyces violaceusniger group]|uniref:Uncharacterized protein n=2 Tax=Streptomyces rapamycinicus TaxID=1226757 RepID=A0A0A0NF97_STRRN|nr:hypothetical protein [Streptomyces rapamycinicus]AGP55886.1 hypothetical protein M271_21835 [Streptomyces rapamycinicus NRRL 5491]MBB4783471.1 hypothetical protein [Streptomyces rapamycinicus]RLV81054.1 hypothetical protein D3C57_121755 [Streptomyces rapamycinicus NRRL 5491]UTO63863.1 hypothetical protein LJB45_17040 [Streptomyces rapamycinicus]UTP31818.1 hypothetical protein LIV37_22155 [Streptomyces rapamycinicus NRRL 5491]